jgi:hypothetical protein
MKLTETLVTVVMVTVQVPAVPQDTPAPAHPWNRESSFGDAVSVTCTPSANAALHPLAPLQEMAAGAEMTVPPPPPANSTVSSYVAAH